jgi:sterol desaturase/sphingolipid hydroxylase (fatty acid hydroxylase superfamily)
VVVVPVWTSTSPDVGAWRRRLARVRSVLAARVYLPACLWVAGAAVLVGFGWATSWGGVNYAGSVSVLRVIVLGPLTLAIIGPILILERVRPAQRRPLIARGHLQDVLYTLLNVALVAPLVTALTLSFAELINRAVPWLVLPRVGFVPQWVAVTVIFVAMDGCNWFVHLINHRVRMLWRFHELHHSQEDLNALSVFRTHPFLHVSYVLALLPGVILLHNGVVSALLLVLYGGWVALAHSNTNLTFGPLGRVFVSPNYHRIHHRLDGAQDVNLGFALTIWDQLFRRAVFPTAETVRIDTGIPGRPLTVEQEGPRPRHLAVLAAQLVGPFRPMSQPVDLPTIRDVPRTSEA